MSAYQKRIRRLEQGNSGNDPDFPVIFMRFVSVDGGSRIGQVIAPWGTFSPGEDESQPEFVMRALRGCPMPPDDAHDRQFELFLAGHFLQVAECVADERPIGDEILASIREKYERLEQKAIADGIAPDSAAVADRSIEGTDPCQ
ncbi:hypothetical protein [Wenxinia saemankumensis]|uniref:Uncharacterized protein n=1 Tax=Wenxinia saemankumensis TaxID=1447782 RepID=A0A1M6HQI6_9RHOB|nr:hypothetical protein [Wenxinia saemankumensis]SHJ24427.1 hypothetical protein SAMN05444417_3295 [Wenxinia saemankumensis]